jgi:hypothetical protein
LRGAYELESVDAQVVESFAEIQYIINTMSMPEPTFD